ncbi:MAG: hypothetical protein BWY68_00668 [bacterium ADurb.Bin400]|nr:MAG: hypothetical protein BWY68_00668 [bacterium ADurb.Bin400]
MFQEYSEISSREQETVPSNITFIEGGLGYPLPAIFRVSLPERQPEPETSDKTDETLLITGAEHTELVRPIRVITERLLAKCIGERGVKWAKFALQEELLNVITHTSDQTMIIEVTPKAIVYLSSPTIEQSASTGKAQSRFEHAQDYLKSDHAGEVRGRGTVISTNFSQTSVENGRIRLDFSEYL